VRRCGAEGARYSPRERELDTDDEPPLDDEGLDTEPPPLELPPPPPLDGRETAEPLLLPLEFGRAPDCPLSCA
jgi:hypothetical protein